MPQNYAEAVRWYRKAAAQGNAYAQYYLGLCYQKGQGVEIDVPRAYAWFQLAADHGHEDAKKEAFALAALMARSEFKMAQQLNEEFKAKYSPKE